MWPTSICAIMKDQAEDDLGQACKRLRARVPYCAGSVCREGGLLAPYEKHLGRIVSIGSAVQRVDKTFPAELLGTILVRTAQEQYLGGQIEQ